MGFFSKYKVFIYANRRTHITLTAQIFSNTKPGDYGFQIPSGALQLALIHSQGSVQNTRLAPGLPESRAAEFLPLTQALGSEAGSYQAWKGQQSWSLHNLDFDSVWLAAALKGRKGYPAQILHTHRVPKYHNHPFLSSTSRVRLSLGAAFGE